MSNCIRGWQRDPDVSGSHVMIPVFCKGEPMTNLNLKDRHPATQEKMRWLEYKHLRPDFALVSSLFYNLALELLEAVSDGPQLTIALQKLIEAKDAAVRQAVSDAD